MNLLRISAETGRVKQSEEEVEKEKKEVFKKTVENKSEQVERKLPQQKGKWDKWIEKVEEKSEELAKLPGDTHGFCAKGASFFQADESN